MPEGGGSRYAFAVIAVSPQSEAMAGAVLTLLSLLVARVYLKEVVVENQPGLSLKAGARTTRLERSSEATAVGIAYLVLALVGVGLMLHAVLRMEP